VDNPGTKANPPLILRELECADLSEAARLLGRGMRDNPNNIRVFGGADAERRCRALTRFFGPVLRGLFRRGSILAAFRGEAMVGVCGMAPPGRCQPTAIEKLGVLPAVVFGNALGTSLRVMKWADEWARRDPVEPHWHLGPVAVDSHLQGQGIGAALMTGFCRRMVNLAALSYLETDKTENVGFYQKFGFSVIGEGDVLGVPNWFMSRPASVATTGREARH
jgi:ribosomal protein S18 acetylase RimI-like enzyme